jgi:hypothetical protein
LGNNIIVSVPQRVSYPLRLPVFQNPIMTIKEDHESRLTALEHSKQARTLWLHAKTWDELEQVEALYQSALNATTTTTTTTTSHRKSNINKRSKTYAELSPSEYRQAGEKLSLLYCQSGRTAKAKRGLDYLGFECRLAQQVLDYPMKSSTAQHHTTGPPSKKKKKLDEPCVIVDNFLHPVELQHLQDTLQDPTASYWSDHDYQVEPPSPYFSYVMDLRDRSASYGFLGDLAKQMQQLPLLLQKFPQLQNAHMVEVWAHNRPHASGHQLHFDSDDEGRGGVRNPVCSTILYLSENQDIGGPSLVTNQRLSSTHLATKGWLAHPQPRRLVVFDGGVLHGVIPGKGVPSSITPSGSKGGDGGGGSGSRRVTLMMAFWKEIQVRDEPTPGSARPFPRPSKNRPKWANQLLSSKKTVSSERPNSLEVARPISLSTVYETLDGEPWTGDMGMPDYDQVFQGF